MADDDDDDDDEESAAGATFLLRLLGAMNSKTLTKESPRVDFADGLFIAVIGPTTQMRKVM
jgi:hypothetical protein